MLKDYCSVCNYADDGFVGIRFRDRQPHVFFPRGYTISEDDNAVRKDIINLIAVLKKFSSQNEGQNRIGAGEEQTGFPILSYQHVIRDYLAHGYYTETETEYQKNSRGKINWKKTIQKIRPQIDGNNAVYLDFITRRSVNKTNIITRIHEFCVYESFARIGWLYLSSSHLPKKPSIPFNRKMFLAVLNDALKNTFNSDKKQLFLSMIEIVNHTEEQSDVKDFQFGVTHFEYVWEKLIDHVFGESNKDIYFPHARWHIFDADRVESSALEPDTVMKHNGKIYILDAKYYKYGVTGIPAHLPATASIQKQITYGSYIAAKRFANSNNIYNAFVMPYAAQNTEDVMKAVGVGVADWIDYSPDTENYKYVLGILLDTKHIMQTYTRQNEQEIMRISNLIENSLQTYRNRFDLAN